MKKIVLATGNPGKARELNALLVDLGLEVMPQSAFRIPEIEETGLSFVENAILKARNAAQHSGLPAVADDSGLEVDALDGSPGIYSARYAGPKASDWDNLEKLLLELRQLPDGQRSAHYQCLLVYMRHALDPTPIICQGTWEGVIARAPRGENGFGYDPIFYLPALKKTAAELDPAEKNRLSHRGQALARLREILLEQFSPFACEGRHQKSR